MVATLMCSTSSTWWKPASQSRSSTPASRADRWRSVVAGELAATGCFVAEHVVGNDQLEDVGGAFAALVHPRVAVQARDRHLLAVAVRAVDLLGQARGQYRGFSRDVLGHRRLICRLLASVEQPRQMM